VSKETALKVSEVKSISAELPAALKKSGKLVIGSGTLPSGNPPLGWRGFPVVKPKRLPATRIFGLRHAFVVELSSGPVRQVSVSPIAGFPVDVIDEGEHTAKVRFIRLNR